MISELCVWDMAASAATVVLRHESDVADRIEAPNWLGSAAAGSAGDAVSGAAATPTGGAGFLVNGGGHLFRAVSGQPPVRLDLGHHTGCNNDHGVSPDGKWIAFSDKVETGESCIYVVAWDGTQTTGMPRRITDNVPSWFHGWRPDGGAIVYVGARADRVVVPFVCDLATGAETCLARGFDHVDGPDMTPRGDYVWFNGERDGAVDLWRVPVDTAGARGAPERMTRGRSVDWFPHPSPCGRHVAFIAYPAGTTGHPFGVEVGLCLMPQAGGPVREVARILGGQGCLNVPSWAPDGHAFAFMRYEA